jgi:hypothetical protein
MSEEHVLVRIERLFQQLLCEVRAIRREVAPHNFSLQLTLYTGDGMSSQVLPITSIALGGNAQLVAQLLESGAPYVAPAGAAPYTFAPTISSSDANVTSAPATVDVTGGAVPLAQQFLLTDSANDTVGAVDAITVSAVAPDGTTVTETINVGVGPAVPVNTFGLSLALYPAPGSGPVGLRHGQTQAQLDAASARVGQVNDGRTQADIDADNRVASGGRTQTEIDQANRVAATRGVR